MSGGAKLCFNPSRAAVAFPGRPSIENLTNIRIFVPAYEERSFTAAAVREHATQSGVSQHVRKLEEVCGVKMFSRNKGQVVPTPAADAYYGRRIQVLTFW